MIELEIEISITAKKNNGVAIDMDLSCEQMQLSSSHLLKYFDCFHSYVLKGLYQPSLIKLNEIFCSSMIVDMNTKLAIKGYFETSNFEVMLAENKALFNSPIGHQVAVYASLKQHFFNTCCTLANHVSNTDNQSVSVK